MDAFSKIRDIVRAEEMHRANEKRPRETQRLTFDLSQATAFHSPFELVHPFKSLLVESVSDPNAIIYFMPNSADIGSNAFKLQMRDTWTTEQLVGGGFFYWPAQPGRTMDIVCFYSSEFKSGSYTQIYSGGVSLSDGTSNTTTLQVASGVNTKILSQSATRKSATIKITVGGDVFFGNNANQNFGPYFQGDTFIYRNSGELWMNNPYWTSIFNDVKLVKIEEF